MAHSSFVKLVVGTSPIPRIQLIVQRPECLSQEETEVRVIPSLPTFNSFKHVSSPPALPCYITKTSPMKTSWFCFLFSGRKTSRLLVLCSTVKHSSRTLWGFTIREPRDTVLEMERRTNESFVIDFVSGREIRPRGSLEYVNQAIFCLGNARYTRIRYQI